MGFIVRLNPHSYCVGFLSSWRLTQADILFNRAEDTAIRLCLLCMKRMCMKVLEDGDDGAKTSMFAKSHTRYLINLNLPVRNLKKRLSLRLYPVQNYNGDNQKLKPVYL